MAVIGVSVCGLLLVAVLIPHVGIVVNGARRWLGHGPIRFQPSELAKLVLVLYLARTLAGKLAIRRRPKDGLLPPLGIIGTAGGIDRD